MAGRRASSRQADQGPRCLLTSPDRPKGRRKKRLSLSLPVLSLSVAPSLWASVSLWDRVAPAVSVVWPCLQGHVSFRPDSSPDVTLLPHRSPRFPLGMWGRQNHHNCSD